MQVNIPSSSVGIPSVTHELDKGHQSQVGGQKLALPSSIH